MSPFEIELAQKLHKKGQTPHKIATTLDRDPKTVRGKLGISKKHVMKVGRPCMPEKDYKKCLDALRRLQKKANGLEEVTAAMVRKAARVSWTEKVIRNAFAKHGLPFRKLREKPLLTPEDIKSRKRFAEKHSTRSAESWVTNPHAVIDNKKYRAYLDFKGRCYAARRSVRGAYRTGGQALEPHLVKPKAALKHTSKGVMITGGVVKGRIRFWHVTEGRWTGAKAVEMYGELAKCLKKAYPDHRGPWKVLEDNDPTGYKSNAAHAKKAALHMKVLELPPRSPDLNVLDYSLWTNITKRLRGQEKKFAKNKKESLEAFTARLRHTALNTPPTEVKKAVRGMRRRLLKIKDEKGGLIEG